MDNRLHLHPAYPRLSKQSYSSMPPIRNRYWSLSFWIRSSQCLPSGSSASALAAPVSSGSSAALNTCLLYTSYMEKKDQKSRIMRLLAQVVIIMAGDVYKRQVSEIFNLHNIQTEIIAASVRHTMHVTECALAGADIATVPYKVIEQMTHHPLTDQGIEKFRKDYEAVFGK